ncbi:MAG TPA: GGDEF domain-containing protein [Spirochaetota bacterium]|nr:GGDEF domain-containing protein [Spirochaetota bacterium]HPC42207.1 GGDEF domain-containing protein [Spirochaetota bacterium]HQF08223.1 GGDEF domain-containing protein [Spirochaetota bacterium]HQH97162.1 GGDEF domain-containing protein [Spirochaetota bacterium]
MGTRMGEKDDRDEKERELGSFDLNVINIMTHLYRSGAVEDEVMETLRMLNFEYHTLLDKNSILEEKVNIDWKTNLLKYRDDYFTMIIKSASRTLDIVPNDKYKITYIRFDIDNFSLLNNRFGHDKGDIVLVDLAEILKAHSRPTDYLIRFGGEEFDVILPSTDLKGGVTYLDKMYRYIRNLKYNFDNTDVVVTVSAGIAVFSMDLNRLKRINLDSTKDEYLKLQKAADDALYDAKLSGKNQYKIYNDKIDYKDVRERYAAAGGRV